MVKDIILLHGALGCAEQLKPLSRLLESNFVVHNIDIIGHGTLAGERKPFGMALFAAYINSYIVNHSLSNPFMFGYSMGGFVALFHSLKYNNKATKIFTLGTKFDWNPESAEREANLLDVDMMVMKVPKLVETLKQRHGYDNWEYITQSTQEMILALGEENPLEGDTLNDIESEVLLMLADDDNMVSYNETIDAADAIPRSHVEVIADSKHSIEKTDLEALAKLIISGSTN